MRTWIVAAGAAACALAWAGGAMAQDGATTAGPDKSAAGTATPPNGISFSVEQVVAGDVARLPGEDFLAGNQSKYKLGYKTQVDALEKLTIEGGAAVGYTDDLFVTGKEGTALTGSLKALWKTPIQGVQPFVAFDLDAGWGGQFGDFDRLNRKTSVGFDYKGPELSLCADGTLGCGAKLQFTGSAAAAQLKSGKETEEHWARLANGKLKATIPNGMTASVEAAANLRRYSNEDIVGEAKRRDNEYSAAVAVDIGPWLDDRWPFLSSLAFAARWVRNDSNRADQSFNRWQAVPSFIVGVKW